MVQIKSCKKIGKKKVYDISMPYFHNFIAEGIVVHNCDLSSRELLVGNDGNGGYLKEKYGDRYAQCSTRGLLRIKSAILDANRFVNKGKVEEEVEKLAKSLPTTPQGVEDKEYIFGYEDKDGNHVEGLLEQNEDLQKYAVDRPEEWDLVKRALSLTRQFGRHACAFVLSDRPIQEDIPIMEISGIKRVTQPEHGQVEWAGLMKYDFLTVSCIKDIELALKYINKDQKLETGYLNHKGEKRFIWDLPEDQDVFKMLSDGKTETVFQLNTVSVTPFVKKIKPESIIDLAAITSLVRPGPLDFVDEKTGRNMAEEYIERRYGRSKGDIPILDELIPESYGVFIQQEQITKVTKKLTGWGDEKAESLREAVGKKKLKLIRELEPQFVEDATRMNLVDKNTAQKIWDMIATFGSYGFNRSHAVGYVVISYACAFLKYHYPLEWWAAVLSNASTKEVNEVLYRYTKDLLLPPDINLSTEQITIDHKQGKLRNRLSMINGVGAKAANNIIAHRPYKNIDDFVSKNVCGPSLSKKLIHVGVLDSLFKDENTLEEKILAYEKAVAKLKFNKKLVEYDEKIANAKDDKEVKKVEKLKERYINKGVKEVDADPEYMLLSAKKDFLMKKAVFPTINMDLNKILQRDSSTKILQGSKFPLVFDQYGKEIYMFSGEQLQTLDGRTLTYDIDFCVPGYVIDTSEFAYHNNTKKAFKLIIDSSGYISEKVIWPDYETGQLHYDENLKKGCMAFFFYNKRAGKPYTNIKHVIIEEKAL